MPSYCTRQARATLDTVSPVESDTRWTWKLRPGMEPTYPTDPAGEIRDWRRQSGDSPVPFPKPTDSRPDSPLPSDLSSALDGLGRIACESGIRPGQADSTGVAGP